MNEIVSDEISVTQARSDAARQRGQSINWGFIGYCLLFAAVAAGWILRDEKLVDPSHGLGYWLGIIGGSLMLFLLFYPAGKKSRLLQRIGLTRHWFRIHIVLGLIGPLLVLYHSNFSVAATNSEVALYSMLAVAISGIFGRYIYARVHRGLHGTRADLDEIRNEIADAMENSRGLAGMLPGFVAELNEVAGRLLGNKYTKSLSFYQSCGWSLKYHYYRMKFRIMINRELRARALESEVVNGNLPELRQTANHYMKKRVYLLRKVARLSFFERLFSVWHVLHLPLFIILIVSALVHVLAVHMF